MITAESICEYVGIEAEYMDEVQSKRVDSVLRASKLWLRGAVGASVDYDDPRAEELMLMVAGEMFEDRTLTDERLSKYSGTKALASLNRLAGDIILQLQYDAGNGDDKE